MGRLEAAKVLIEGGADVNDSHKEGEPPLYAVATGFKNNVEIMRELIKHGADVNKAKEKGETPLDMANKKGNAEIADIIRKALLNEEKELNIPPPIPPKRAVQKSHYKPYKIDGKEYYSKLHWAIMNRYIEEVKILIKEGVDVNQELTDGNISLHYAVEKQLYETAKVLIKAGANVNKVNNEGKTPYDLIKSRDANIRRLFNIEKNIEGYFPLYRASMHGNLREVTSLIKESADINKASIREETSLYVA